MVTRKNKLYGDHDSGSGCSCSCPLTGDITSFACMCVSVWSMVYLLRQQYQFFFSTISKLLQNDFSILW